MTISSQTLCVDVRRKWGVGFIHTQLASSYANAPQQLASSRSTVGFITRDFHALISRQHSQTNRRGLHTLFLTSKYRCMKKNQLCRCPTYHTKRVVLIRSLRRRPYRMKPTAVGFISLTTACCDIIIRMHSRETVASTLFTAIHLLLKLIQCFHTGLYILVRCYSIPLNWTLFVVQKSPLIGAFCDFIVTF